MARRDNHHHYIDASGDYVIHVARGHEQRRYVLSRAMLIGGALAAGVLVTGIMAAAGYLLFRDDMLAGLLDRQTQMQYAYEDRLAAARLRLDQVTSRQFLDQDGVEGKVQNLVIRQARLETRAAVMAQLVERTVGRDSGASAIAVTPRAAAAATDARAGALQAAAPKAPMAALLPLPPPRRGGLDDSALPQPGKPQPEGMDLRLGHDGDPDPAPARKGGEIVPVDTSMAPRSIAPASFLAHAADPDLPMPTRLDSLAFSLDRIERDQAARVSGIARPALDAAGRLRRAFDIAGLAVERYLPKGKTKAPPAVGGPFLPADPKGPEAAFERDLAAAQSAVETLDGLRKALPATPLRKPLAGELQMTSTFGYRTDPFLGRPALHSGVDLREEYGEPARATAGGVVTVAGPNGGYGNMVEVDHGDGLATRYAHLSAISVSVGQQLAPGAIVGKVGSTGRSTGPHLHYEVRVDGEAVDPTRFLRAAAALGGEW